VSEHESSFFPTLCHAFLLLSSGKIQQFLQRTSFCNRRRNMVGHDSFFTCFSVCHGSFLVASRLGEYRKDPLAATSQFGRSGALCIWIDSQFSPFFRCRLKMIVTPPLLQRTCRPRLLWSVPLLSLPTSFLVSSMFFSITSSFVLSSYSPLSSSPPDV